MASRSLTKSATVALGCVGAAIATPLIAPHLAITSIPFFGAVLAGIFKDVVLPEGLSNAIVNTVTGLLTNIGSSAAWDIPATLSREHNYHLEKMLATAYLESLEAVGKEIEAGRDAELKAQAVRDLPLITDRLKRGLKEKELSLLFPLQTTQQPAETAFANRLSAEKVSLLVADEERWREQLGDEVLIALRRWLSEEQAALARAAKQTQLGLATDARLPEPLRSRLRAQLPPRIAQRISELVKHDDFKESWIAFQRAHLQAMTIVLGRIEGSQADIRQSVDALTERLEGFINQDGFVAALAGMQQEFLSQLSLSHDKLAQLLERQSDDLHGLSVQIEQSTERLSREGKQNTEQLSEQIESLDKKVSEAILQEAVRAAQNRLKQLPTLREFVGREAEIEELRQALRRGGATISGVQGLGGVGKTALALKLAHEFKDRYADAQIFLDLKGVSERPLTPAEVMWHVVSSFQPEMKRPDDNDLPAWYNSLLNDHRVLLFYDNARDGAQIAPLLPPEHCLLLVTSRKHFTLRGMFDKNLDEMTEADARELLLKIEPRIREHASAMAEQCGYLPIALCAAASALKVKRTLSPEDYVKRLQDRKARLKLHDETRDLTVEACFSLSYELLSEEMQRRWRALAIFPTDFDAPAAAAVWQTDVDAAKDALAELEEYSLIEWDAATRRYSLHDLARDFADTRLSETEREQAGLLHAAHYLQLLSTADDLYHKGGEAIAEGLSLFDSERVNIEAGQAWTVARPTVDVQAARLCNEYPNAGGYVLNLRQHPRDFISWQEAALRAARELGDYQSEGNRLGSLGLAYDSLGEVRTAIDYYEQAIAIAREIGDRRGEGIHLGNLGYAYADLGEVRRAIDYYEQALTIARDNHDRRNEGSWLGSLGLAYFNLGEVRTAIDYYEQAIAIAREVGDRRNEGVHLGNLGNAYSNLGEVRTAIDYYEQALIIAREIGDQRGEGSRLGGLGLAYSDLGEVRTAIDYYEQGIAIAREVGDRRNEGVHLTNLGLAYADLGDIRTAIDYYEQALIIAREIGDRRGEGNSLGNLGVAYRNLGETEKAMELMEAALKIFEETESPHANVVRGWLEGLRGESK